MISQFRRKQSFVEVSTIEEEYVTVYSASCEVVWLRKILYDLVYLTFIFLYDAKRSNEAPKCHLERGR